MAKSKDTQTLDLPGIPKRRGRPSSGKAMTGAERQRRYRSVLRSRISVTGDENSTAFDRESVALFSVAVETVEKLEKSKGGRSNTPYESHIFTFCTSEGIK